MARFNPPPLLAWLLLSSTAALLTLAVFVWQIRSDTEAYNQNLRQESQRQSAINRGLQERNRAVLAEVELLRSPDSVVLHEERAREDYGLIREGEIFFRMDLRQAQPIPDVPGLNELLAQEQKHRDVPVDLEGLHKWRRKP